MKPGLHFWAAFLGAVLLTGARASTLQISPGPGAAPASPPPPSPGARSRVVLVERPSAVNHFTLNPAAVVQMWREGFLRLTGQKTEADGWRSLGVTANDVVGIKIAAHGNDLVTPPPFLVDAMARGLIAAGVLPGHIIVWDRDGPNLAPTAYAVRDVTRPYLVRNVVPDTGFDANAFYVNEITGKLIWGDLNFRGKTRDDLLRQADMAGGGAVGDDFSDGTPKGIVQQELADQTSNRSYFAKILTQTCTKIVNVAVMIDDESVGLGGCLSSLALGSVDNNRRFLADGVNGDPAIAEILDRDLFRKKTVLHVTEGLIAQYAGGPSCAPEFTRSPGALYLSADPVAIDSLVLPRLEAWRQQAQVVPIGNLARHVKGADAQGLGTSDPARIDLIKIP
ncbi:MAG: DUF362 domain-containing protein [Verrucomicrobium sp.]|nr:DUF362 domain-containing protein [Verrucomicrobium sp.]